MQTSLKAWRSKRAAAAVATFSLGVMALVACAASVSTVGQGAVPWVDSPGTSSMQSASLSSATRGCAARDFRVVVGPTGAYQGRSTQELTIQNIAPDACHISAPPALAIGLDNGRQVPVNPDQSTSMIGASNGRDDLPSGTSVQILIGTPGACAGAGNPIVSKIVKLTLSATDVLTVSGVWINIECGHPVLLGFNRLQAPMAVVPASSLRAKLTIPNSATPGQALVYFVTLTNASNQTVVLVPCPSYTQSVGIANPVRETLLLNCAAASPIGAGASLTFEMRFLMPGGLSKGITKLGWQLEVPSGAFAGTALTVQ